MLNDIFKTLKLVDQSKVYYNDRQLVNVVVTYSTNMVTDSYGTAISQHAKVRTDENLDLGSNILIDDRLYRIISKTPPRLGLIEVYIYETEAVNAQGDDLYGNPSIY